MQPIYSQPHPLQETVFYQDASPVFISSQRAVFFNQTFMAQAIVSVSVKEVNPPRNGEIAVILGGLVLTVFACVALASSKLTLNGAFGLIILFLFSTGLLIFGLFRYFNAAPRYALLVGTPAGQMQVMTSPDSAYITALQTALNQALTYL